MKVIIEGYDYPADRVKDILIGFDQHSDAKGCIHTDYVGYLYNPNILGADGKGKGDCVFILPKVVLYENNKVFGHIDPLQLIDVENCTELKDKVKESEFLYNFAVWIYRAICVYRKAKPENGIVYEKLQTAMNAGVATKFKSESFLDVIIALCKFNRDNQDFFMHVLKNIHSGFNKINWTRTISRSTAIVQKDEAVYLNPVNKKRVINFDEELLIIFFSILQFIKEEYGFPVNISVGYNLITGVKFKSYINGYGATRLRQIKYKYFSDKALQLWNLCYAFFEHAHPIFCHSNKEEYLLVKDFNRVFEAMIDELIGDKEGEVPKGLKNQKDGKIVDHIYQWDGLMTVGEEDPRIFYIGDSKYYKRGNSVNESKYKQFTYAHNLIQWNLDLFLSENEEEKKKYKKYRDDITEGYDIVPNFFISAMIDKELSYKDYVVPTDKYGEGSYIQMQFRNRLFDRDTLLISHYDVNFLHIISLYAKQNESLKASWRRKVRNIFRDQIRQMLTDRYDFYAMAPKSGPIKSDYIRQNFKKLLGKVYMPYQEKEIYSLALDKKDDDPEVKNKDLLDELEKYFYLAPLKKLSDDPHAAIENCHTTVAISLPPFDPNEDTSEENVLVGYVRTNERNYEDFVNNKAKDYLLLKGTKINLLKVKYFLPLYQYYINGYYTVKSINVEDYTDEQDPTKINTGIRLTLGDFVKFGETSSFVTREIKVGSLISLDECIDLYTHGKSGEEDEIIKL